MGKSDIRIKPEAAKLYCNDVLVASAYAPLEVLNTAVEGKKGWIEKYSGEIMVPRSSKKPPRILFFAPDVDITTVTDIELDINGRLVRIPGRLYTPEEIRDGYKKAKELQSK